MAGRDTPVMEQWARAKRGHPDAILFFRLGDFYEMFEGDALLAAPLLDLTLTSRNKGKPDEVPMAGVPHHSAHGYIARLLALGHKVALCEQMADPSKTRGIVPREVVRVITPGLTTDEQQLESGSHNWLCAIEVGAADAGVALLDVSTGALEAAVLPDAAAVLGELSRAAPREVLVAEGETELLAAVKSALPSVALRADRALVEDEVDGALGVLLADSRAFPTSARRAVARALRFARACTPGAELPVRRIARFEPSGALLLDAAAQAHLELSRSVSGTKQSTLLGVIDVTRTPAGARLLGRRLLAPLVDVARIRRRLDRVELFVVHSRVRSELRGELSEVGDLERLAMRASFGDATPRDLGALRDGLGAARRAAAVLEALDDAELCAVLGLGAEPVDTVTDVRDELGRALVDRPPARIADGAALRPGFDPELDELSVLKQSGAEQLTLLEARYREQTGIGSLKVRYTRVFGWYVEVSRAHAARVPATFRRKQTVATGERYSTAELDDLADRITHAEERHRELELARFRELVESTARQTERIRALAATLARWDVAAALAEVAHRSDYCRPEVDAGNRLLIRDGRHPVVERLAAAGRFVPNDVALDVEGERLWLVTGPNMAGKSTLLRQTALIVILAQLGSYVPARSARIGVVDRVLSRVGASDDVSRGESTFMVEMRETAEILRSATRRSLVILDEIGRGTSTFDGLAIAWAVAEHLDEAIGCRALFATHYHELTALAEQSAHAANHSVSARELDGDVVFLHRLVPGAASRSYGVAVAKLAGLPESVLARARAVLEGLEGGDGVSAAPNPGSGKPNPTPQLGLFSAPVDGARGQDVLATLAAVDVDRLSPLDALALVVKLKSKL